MTKPFFPLIVISSLVLACSDDDTNPPNQKTDPGCKPTTIAWSQAGNFYHETFTYAGDKLSKVVQTDQFGQPTRTQTFQYAQDNSISSVVTQTDATVTLTYSGGDRPASAQVNVNGSDYNRFDFAYTSKGQLETVAFVTPTIDDWEWTLKITYNDAGNVTTLDYVFTTGPNAGQHSVVTADDYDNKPGIYSALPEWKFSHAGIWNNSDPFIPLSALSKNNPLRFSLSGMPSTCEYLYDQASYPSRLAMEQQTSQGTRRTTADFLFKCE